MKMRLFYLMAFLYASGTFGRENILPEKDPTISNEWWSNTIIYQVYPRSFQDSDNDGIGDLRGIISRLDHFVDLGIGTLWIGPLFKSPQYDMGYDVEDFKMIDPVFGTMDDFENLVLEMNKRNLKLITDFIPNHSSYKCEWFQKSIQRDEKYDKYYIWRDAKNQEEVLKNSSVSPIVPNNWLSLFGDNSSAWNWNNERKQFYYHKFSAQQPDFNLRNSDVHNDFFEILEYWMDKGVAGFRFDAMSSWYENEIFADEPYVKGKEGIPKYQNLIHIYTRDQPENFEMIYDFRNFFDNYSKRKKTYSRIMVTELYSRNLRKCYGNSTHPGAQIPMNFGLVRGINKDIIINSVDSLIHHWIEIDVPEDAIPNWVMENHDNNRMSTKLGSETSQLLTAMKLALPGVDITYYGSEIGMENTIIRSDQTHDLNEILAPRDGERCPMQWDSSINAGFTQAYKPWLPVNPNYYKLNVAAQKNEPTSNYNFYKKMSRLRNTNTLKYGGLKSYIMSRSIYIIKRYLSNHESYLVVMNFGSETETVVLSNVINDLEDKLFVYLGSENSAYDVGNIVSTNSAAENPLKLRPKSVVILTEKEIKADLPTKATNRSIRTGSKLISLFCAFIISKFIFMT